MRDYKEPNIKRLLKAFKLEKADRVPYWEPGITNEKIRRFLLGRKLGKAIKATDHVELAKRIGTDAIGFGVYYSPGRVIKRSSDGCSHYAGGSIKNWGDLKTIKRPRVKSLPGLAKLETYLEATKNIDIGVWAYVHGPFDPVYLGMGLTDFMLKLYDDFKFVEYLMDFILEVQCEIVEEMVKLGLSFIRIGDDVAINNGLLIRPGLFKKLYVPRLKKLIEPAKETGIPVTFHSDGNIEEIIPILIDLGVCALDPIEPYSNDIYEVKRKYGDKVCLVGNIDLINKTPEEVEKDVEEHIGRLAQNGGYVVSPNNSITEDVSPENFMGMIKTVQEYGRY